HWDGNAWTQYHLWDMGVLDQNDGGVTRIWGSSPNDIYFVGRRGTIVHYDGSGWQRMESGTELPIQDIWGAWNEREGKWEILAVAEDYGNPGGSKILSIDSSVREMLTEGLLSWSIWGVWFVPNHSYIVVGSGVWRSYSIKGRWSLDDTLPRLFSTSIDGQDLNDIVVCGAFWLLAHWNGMSWKTYFPRTFGSFTAVQIKDDLIVAVGGADNKAIIAFGIR
ncbi:MAG: hypothetical protein D6732_27585, partial [Methanobacteriota archaeon]